MTTLAGELAGAIESARAALEEAQGTEFESYLRKLVADGVKAQGELAARSEADVQELIAALNEGARATTLILNGKKQLATRETTVSGAPAKEASSTVEMAGVKTGAVTVKAEAVTVQAEKTTVAVAKVESPVAAQAETVAEARVAEVATTEAVAVPNTSAGRGVADGSVVPGAWGTMALVLLAMAMAGAWTARHAKLEAE